MMPPEPQHDHKALPKFWSGLTQLLAFTATTFAIVYGVRHVENRAHDALLGN
jgi:hypothetical protein